jgi:hypothetical protein
VQGTKSEDVPLEELKAMDHKTMKARIEAREEYVLVHVAAIHIESVVY